jgi:hypothetical protein
MSVTVCLILAALSVAAIACFWNEIREVYLSYFQKWIKERCGEYLGNLCDRLFISLDKKVRFARREWKIIKQKLRRFILTYTEKDSETVEIKKTVVVQTEDGDFAGEEVTKNVSINKIPIDLITKIKKDDTNSYTVDGIEIIEKKLNDEIEDPLEN